MTVTVRPAKATDAEAICRIHNQGIEDRIATLDTTLRTPEDSRAWLGDRGPRHPVLAAEVDGIVVGWASLNQYSPRAAYDYVADFSVYVERGHRGQGIGRQLLDRLIRTARGLGFHKMVLAALVANLTGIALYRRAGFTAVGVFREQGLLDDRWVDVMIMEKLL